MKILVIDDEKPTLSMFKLFLTAYGYEVYTAESGEAGLELFQQIMPGIVFTDIKMPGIDGLKVLDRIRKADNTVQVIIITGHGDMEKAVEALDLNASDFINKPVERQALNSALERAEKRAQMDMAQAFSCHVHQENKTALIKVSGRLTGSGKKALYGLKDNISWEDTDHVVFGFDDSFSIDRNGIKLLMGILMEIKQHQVPLFMKGLSYNYIKFFQMAGMNKIVRFEDTQAPSVI